jgi:HemY protein
MLRIISFLVLIALAAAGATWVAEQSGDVSLSWGPWRAATSLPVFVLLLGLVILAVMLAWALLRGVWRMPARWRRSRRDRRQARGRHAITDGLLAIGHGDSAAAKKHAAAARRLVANDPLSLLLQAQSAQLDGDRDGANRAFRAMAEREDTRLLGLRGLFIEAQRSEDPHAAVTIAEEALKLAPGSTWASQALLGFRCAQGDWNGALSILDNNLSSGLIDRAAFRRQRGVLLTARAQELETVDRDLARESIVEAVKLAPTLVPAAVLAARFQSEAHQIRRALKILEAAWIAQPHPDLAEAYAHAKPGDAARQRLVRIETLAAKAPGHIESALAIARAAIDATEYGRAREVLEPFIADPTQRVAILMAEIERTENGDSGRARAWTIRAVRARHDPVWTADGYVSDIWRPVSPVSGRIDAFQWQTPLASLPSDRMSTIESDILRETVLAPPPRAVSRPADPVEAAPATPAAAVPAAAAAAVIATAHSETPPAAKPASGQGAEPAEAEPATAPEPAAPAQPEVPPLFFRRPDLTAKPPTPAVIPILRAPDDPGVDEDEEVRDEFAELNAGQQAGGWRGFIGRIGS